MPGTGLGINKLTATALHTINFLLVSILISGENVQAGIHGLRHLRQRLQIRVWLELVWHELLSIKSLHKLEPAVRVRDGSDDLVLLHPAEIISHLSPDLGLHVVHLLVALPLDGQLVLVPQDEDPVPLVVPLERSVANKEKLLHKLPQPTMFTAASLLAAPTSTALLGLKHFSRVIHAVLEYYLGGRVLW